MTIPIIEYENNLDGLRTFELPGYTQLYGNPTIGDKIKITGQEITLVDFELMLVDVEFDDCCPKETKSKIDYLFHWGWYCNGCGHYHEAKTHWKLPVGYVCDSNPTKRKKTKSKRKPKRRANGRP